MAEMIEETDLWEGFRHLNLYRYKCSKCGEITTRRQNYRDKDRIVLCSKCKTRKQIDQMYARTDRRIEEAYQQGRADAIDKFAEKIKHHIMNDWNMDLSDCDECVFCLDKVNAIAEQLKEQIK